MARVELASETTDDFIRIFDHLVLHNVPDKDAHINSIYEAIEVLASSPLIGRPISDDGLRELVIGRRTRGYMALYRYVPDLDCVTVLAIRAQREKRYPNVPH